MFQSPNRVKPLSNGRALPLPCSMLDKFQSPNRVKPLSNVVHACNYHSNSPQFQSPNRVKPLSNVLSVGLPRGCSASFNRPIASNLFPTQFRAVPPPSMERVSIAQSRQTSFQQQGSLENVPLSDFVSIAQSRQTSFQRKWVQAVVQLVQSFNRPIASNLFPTDYPVTDIHDDWHVSIAQSRQTSFQRLNGA